MRSSLGLVLSSALLAAVVSATPDSEPPDDSARDAAPASKPEASPDERTPDREKPTRTVVSGKVVLLADAFKQRGIKASDEEIKGQVVLATPDGELIPIVPDWRGRAFYQDERLRDRPVDLIVNRRSNVPWVQVLSVYLFDENGARSVMDYWCDICSIPMYEIKDCECCQGPIRLRLRPQELPRETKTTKPPGKAAD